MMQKNNVNIRPAIFEDSASVAKLEEMCFSSPWSESAILETMSGETSCFLVAECDGVVCGYIGAYSVADEGYITNVAVDVNKRRCGIGQALAECLIEEGRKRKLAFWTLEVRESNTAARTLYEKIGFEIVGKRPRFYTNPTEAAVLMTIYI